MEELIAYAVLISVGYDLWSEYKEKLDALFLEEPERDDLLELESMERKQAILHLISPVTVYDLGVDRFGKALMEAIRKIYDTVEDIARFSWKMYEVSNRLPAVIEYGTDPFFMLNYASDCLGYADEEQCRDILERAMSYYD